MVKVAKSMHDVCMQDIYFVYCISCLYGSLPWLFESLGVVERTSANCTGEFCSFINISKSQLLDYVFSNGTFNCTY